MEHNYKGLTKDLKAQNGFQYEAGKEYETDKAEACVCGFHACRDPIDCFSYFPPATSRYFEVEQDGKLSEHEDDTKVASTKIKIGAEIGIPGIVKGHIEWVKSHITNEHNAEKGKPATAGDHETASAGERGVSSAGEYGVSSAGEYGVSSAGERGVSSAGDGGVSSAGWRGVSSAGDSGVSSAGDSGVSSSRGSSSVGINGLAVVRGNGVKAKGGIGAVLVLCEEKSSNYDILFWKAFVIDGKQYKADVWYQLDENGEVVIADE